MDQGIRFFEVTAGGAVTIEHDHWETRIANRDVWFDQDVDGRWLVGVTTHNGALANGDEDAQTGAIIVRNRDAAAFIALFGELIAEPGRFYHEPAFHGAGSTAMVDARKPPA